MRFHSDRTQVNKKKETIAALWFEYPSQRPPTAVFFFHSRPAQAGVIGVLLKMRAEEKKSNQATGLFFLFSLILHKTIGTTFTQLQLVHQQKK